MAKYERVPREHELWEAAKLKAKQLVSEIDKSSATPREKANMQHTLSKLWMFATDEWEMTVLRPEKRRQAKARSVS